MGINDLQPGLRSRNRCRKESEVFGWSASRIPNNIGSLSRIFCPNPDVRFDRFLHHTLKLVIPVEMVQFLFKLLLKQISCCVPRFPLILAAKFHSLYVKESESGVGYFTSDSATLVATSFILISAGGFHIKLIRKKLTTGDATTVVTKEMFFWLEPRFG